MWVQILLLNYTLSIYPGDDPPVGTPSSKLQPIKMSNGCATKFSCPTRCMSNLFAGFAILQSHPLTSGMLKIPAQIQAAKHRFFALPTTFLSSYRGFLMVKKRSRAMNSMTKPVRYTLKAFNKPQIWHLPQSVTHELLSSLPLSTRMKSIWRKQ